MSPYLIRSLLENSMRADTPADSPHAESQAKAIDGIMEKLLASAECLGRLDGTVEAVAGRTILPTLDVAIEAAQLADEGKSFAAMARDLKNMADQTTLSASGILWQCEIALDMVKKSARALEEVAGPAGARLFLDDPEAVKPEPSWDTDERWNEGNVIAFPSRTRRG